MNELAFKIPRRVEVELTSKCTLGCPACPRTYDSTERRGDWKLGELDISAMEALCKIPSIGEFIFCGAFGDPIYHSKLFDIIDLCHQYNKRVAITTAASYRNAKWWTELSNKLTSQDSVQFSVDGLKHNNHIYRINCDWGSIETGMRIIAKSRAYTEWKWILFKHNENDVLEGYKLSKEFGIKEFTVIETKDMRTPAGMKPTRTYQEVLQEIKEYHGTPAQMFR